MVIEYEALTLIIFLLSLLFFSRGAPILAALFSLLGLWLAIQYGPEHDVVFFTIITAIYMLFELYLISIQEEDKETTLRIEVR